MIKPNFFLCIGRKLLACACIGSVLICNTASVYASNADNIQSQEHSIPIQSDNTEVQQDNCISNFDNDLNYRESIKLLGTCEFESLFCIDAEKLSSESDVKKSSNAVTYVIDADSNEYYAEKKDLRYSVPEAFCFDNDNIYILDTYASRIIVASQGKMIQSIELEDVGYASEIAAFDGTIYVLDESSNAVVSIRQDEIKTIELPYASEENWDDNSPIRTFYYPMAPLVISMKIRGGQLIVDCGEYGTYRLENDTFVKTVPDFQVTESDDSFIIKNDFNTWTIPSYGIGIDVLGSDEVGKLYVLCEEAFIDSEGHLVGDSTVRIYDSSSKLLEAAYVNAAERFAIPRHRFILDNKYNICEMKCDRDSLGIDLIHTVGCKMIKAFNCTESCSICNNECLTEEACDHNVSTSITTSNSNENDTYSAHNNGLVAENIMKQYTSVIWKVNSKNQNEWGKIKLHTKIKNATSGTQFIGMPYARGGDDTVSKFLERLKTDYSSGFYSAGDITNGTRNPGSTGADCSGYASRVYNIWSGNNKYTHINSTTFESKVGYLVSGNTLSALAKKAKPLDFWVKGSYHIMIHDNFISSNGRVYVYDASRATGFIQRRYWTLSEMQSHDFKLKTPWHTGNCSPTDNYYKSSTQHWKQCTNSSCSRRLQVQAHTWITHGMKSVCSVCGYVSISGVSPNGISESIYNCDILDLASKKSRA